MFYAENGAFLYIFFRCINVNQDQYLNIERQRKCDSWDQMHSACWDSQRTMA